MTAKAAQIRSTLAELLKTTEANLNARLAGMKLSPVCSRCGGSGCYSFNAMHGSTCYGCGGKGVVNPKDRDYPAILDRTRAAVEAGELDRYTAAIRARAFAKGGAERLFAAWKDMDKLNGYSANWRKLSDTPNAADIKRRNDIGYAAVDAFDKASGRLDGRRADKIDWVEAARILQDGLDAIAAAKAELEPA